MREYVKPDIKVINLRVEERISGSCIIVGSCLDPGGQMIVTNNI